MIGRRLRNVWRFQSGTTSFASRGPGASPAAFAAEGAFQSLGQGDTTQVLAAIGMRVHLGKPLILNADVILPVTRDGLTPKAGVVAGFSVAF